MTTLNDKALAEMTKAALSGGRVLRRYFGQEIAVEVKSVSADFRTPADVRSEKAIVRILERAFPRYNILSEEMGERGKGSEFTFVIDPLDGTNNYVLGVPYFSVSIALLNGESIIAAVVHQPLTGRTYSAQVGGGAFLDGKSIRVNQKSEIARATFSEVYPYRVDREDVILRTSKIWQLGCRRLMTLWAPALDFCLLASGKIEAVMHYGSEFHDYAAGKLIAREAGAKITALDGTHETSDRNTQFLVSNGTAIHQQLVVCLKFRSDAVEG